MPAIEPMAADATRSATMTSPESRNNWRAFFARVWAPPHNLDASDELMSEDYHITTAGVTIAGRDAFKRWVALSRNSSAMLATST